MISLPAIVIATYNRPGSLLRLLSSIENSVFNSDDIPLVISIDGGGSNHKRIVQIAESFKWLHGEKIIIKHQENLGLREHILSCGDLSYKYDAVIVLEDDLYVSPYFYQYSLKALEFYKSNDNIAQISLYSFNIHIHTLLPFKALQEEYDTYFMQYPSSWGQVWTKDQWDGFRKWYNKGQQIKIEDKIPKHIKLWPETSWLKYFIKYQVDCDKYTVYPHLAYSTNFNEAGIHNKSDQGVFQCCLANHSANIQFAPFEAAAVKYDVYFEISKEYILEKNESLKDFNHSLEIDLYGVKFEDDVDAEYFISTRKSKNPILTYPLLLKPIELNLIHEINSGDQVISLAKKSDFLPSRPNILLWNYFTLPLPFKLSLLHFAKQFCHKISLRLKLK